MQDDDGMRNIPESAGGPPNNARERMRSAHRDTVDMTQPGQGPLWMQQAREIGERIEGLLLRAAMQWSVGQQNPAKATLFDVNQLIAEQEQIIKKGMGGC